MIKILKHVIEREATNRAQNKADNTNKRTTQTINQKYLSMLSKRYNVKYKDCYNYAMTLKGQAVNPTTEKPATKQFYINNQLVRL